MTAHDIAIIGMACKLPYINNLEEFYETLIHGEHPGSVDKSSVHSFESNWDESFDHKFFFIPNDDAAMLDPQQKIFLAAAYWAQEDALLKPEDIPENTGVYLGVSSYEFALKQHHEENLALLKLSSVGSNFIANRVSNFFNINGPSFSVDSACASSMVAVKLASDALRNGEIDLAFAGGVHVKNSQQVEAHFSNSGVLSKTDNCLPMSLNADGYMRGEGVGAIVLKRLEDALDDGDKIYAIIKGVGTAHSGTSLNILTPNLKSQLALYHGVYNRLGISPAAVNYIETSASGLPLADKIEFKGIKQYFYAEGRSQPLRLGVNKHIFGNLEAASSIISLIKVALILYKNNLSAQNINNDLGDDEIQINFNEMPFENSCASHYAAINSFGLGGLNAHLVLQRAVNTVEPINPTPGPHCLLISAKSKESLNRLVSEYLALLDGDFDGCPVWCDLVSSRKSSMRYRLAVVFSNKIELVNSLRDYLDGIQANNLWQGEARYEPEPKFIISNPFLVFSKFHHELVKIKDLTIFWERSRLKLEAILDFTLPEKFNGFASMKSNLEICHVVVLFRLIKTFMSDKLFHRSFPVQAKLISCLESQPDCELDFVEFTNSFAVDGEGSWLGLTSSQASDVEVNLDFSLHNSLCSIQAQMFCLGIGVKYQCDATPSQIINWLPNYPFFSK